MGQHQDLEAFDEIHSTSNIFKSLMKAMAGIQSDKSKGMAPVDLSDYDPSKDPYFGQMNQKLKKQTVENKAKQNVQNHPVAKQQNLMQPVLQYPLQSGYAFNPYRPPSGDPNDPYGFNTRYNPQYYPQTQLRGPY